jgi:hypothetical protein
MVTLLRTKALLVLGVVAVCFLALGPNVLADAKKRGRKKKKDQTNHFSMQLKVPESKIGLTLEDAKKLLEFGKKEKMGQPLLISLRSVVQKLEGKHRTQKKKEAKAAEVEKNRKLIYGDKTSDESATPDGHEQDEEAVTFSIGARRTKPLKRSMQAKKCNFPTYTAEEFANKYQNGEIDIYAPFKITDAETQVKKLREIWTISKLRTKTNSTIKYLSPMMAKMMQEGQRDPTQGQTVEMLQPTLVSPAEYFANCFGEKKKTGTETEYCEQTVPALHFGDDSAINGFSVDAIAGIALKQVMDVATRSLMKKMRNAGTGFKSLVETEDTFIKMFNEKDSRRIVLGPAGSGTQMKYTGVPLFDSLVHGSRRWFALSPKKRSELLKASDGGFGTAFNFFEDKYAELQDDHDMKVDAKDGIWECSQEAGEFIYIPVGTYRTSLSLQDSISYSQELLMHKSHVTKYVEATLWQPQSQTWTAGVCLTASQMERLPGIDEIGISPNGLVEAMREQLHTPKQQNGMLLQAVLICKGVLELGLPAGETLCDFVYPRCVDKLAKNIKKLKIKDELPWLKKEKKLAKKMKKKERANRKSEL